MKHDPIRLLNCKLAPFVRDESGASTVSWVSLAAALVTMAIASTSLITDTVRERGTSASNAMSDYEISYEFGADTVNPDASQILLSPPTSPVAPTPTE